MSARTRQRDQAAVFGALSLVGPAYGFDVLRVTGLRSGALYTALTGLEDRGLICSWWDEGTYPRRRMYDVALPSGFRVQPAVAASFAYHTFDTEEPRP